MTIWTLVRRSFRFHLRAHAGVILGGGIGSAALVGALIVGDSVRESLRERALLRLQNVHYAMATGDRFFRQDLGERIQSQPMNKRNVAGTVRETGQTGSSREQNATGLLLTGTAARQDENARANRVQIFGVDPVSWPDFGAWKPALSTKVLERWRVGEVVFLNRALARQLAVKPGDEVILRVRKPTALALDAVIAPRNSTSLALRMEVGAILPAELLGDFDLSLNQVPAANAFVALDYLAQKLEFPGRANLLIFGPLANGGEPEDQAQLSERLRRVWSLADAQLSLREIELTNTDMPARAAIELTTSRVFLEPQIIQAALKPQSGARDGTSHPAGDNQENDSFIRNGVGVLTYLANLIQAGARGTPYSMVTAAGPPYTPADMHDDEVMVNQWLADDLQVTAGDTVGLAYYVVDSGSHLVERTNVFRVRQVVPLAGVYGDRSLMPDFPGLARAESTHDWDTGFPLVNKIREKDEAYWKAYRGTPKAFLTLAMGQAMWTNRFGSLTSVRYNIPANISSSQVRTGVSRSLLANLPPEELGCRLEPVRAEALKAAQQSQDFGQLFLAFSLFLVVAALLLMELLFQFGLEQRAREIGTLLALGFTSKQVRQMLLLEGAVLAIIGGLAGAAGGLAYAKAMLWGLTTVWKGAVSSFRLTFHVTVLTLVIGVLASTAVAMLTIWLTLRKQARRPAHELLAGGGANAAWRRKSRGAWIGSACALAAVAGIIWAFTNRQLANAEAFFGAGSLLLVAGLSFASAWLTRLAGSHEPSERLSTAGLAVRGCGRRHKRSLATVALLACGSFIILSVGVFRQDANLEALSRSSGTGGFALIGQAALPVVQDLNTSSGLEFFGLNPQDLAGARFVPFRVRQGDEASCLNLNRAQKPRLLGVKPESLAGRFTFASLEKSQIKPAGWSLLKSAELPVPVSRPSEIPAIGDANSIEWALGKKIGDTIDYVDERGRPFKLRLVGAVANSILQGSLIIDEAEFVKRFPSESGYRFFLIDTSSNSMAQISATLSRALQDNGLELTPAVQRLNAFNEVQNTYLGTFQVLGGLGLLLGSAGLGVVVLRNVLERRGELALFLAVGFRKPGLQWLVLAEHGVLLGLGLGLGIAAGAIAELPSLLPSGARLPYQSLGLTLAAIFLNGVIWTWLATVFALRGNLLEALRNE